MMNGIANHIFVFFTCSCMLLLGPQLSKIYNFKTQSRTKTKSEGELNLKFDWGLQFFTSVGLHLAYVSTDLLAVFGL